MRWNFGITLSGDWSQLQVQDPPFLSFNLHSCYVLSQKDMFFYMLVSIFRQKKLRLSAEGGVKKDGSCAKLLTSGGNLEGQNDDLSNVSLRRREARDGVGEEKGGSLARVESEVGEGGRKLFPCQASRGPIVGSPAGAFSPQLQLIGCPTTWPPVGCVDRLMQ